MANADCIVIQGSNMAECHPVGFQWVEEARARGARVIHVDPRFTRTSAVSDRHIPIRAGSDIVLIGALINHVLSNDLWFREYVIAYTNAATIINEKFRDTEDLNGLFSGFDPETGQYDTSTWAYEEEGNGQVESPGGGHTHGATAAQSGAGHEHGSGGPPLANARVKRDETLQHPRTVFQIVKRHFARYTPEMVTDVCGITRADFDYLARSIVENSGRERTTCFAYAVGWTQHTLGAQFIRSADILQLLLGNVGRPGSGIMALRGHATIQGSTDIPTLFNLLPGYLPMPKAGMHDTLADYLDAVRSKKQKGYLGQRGRLHHQLAQGLVGGCGHQGQRLGLRLPAAALRPARHLSDRHGMLDDEVEGYFLLGQNPAVGSAHGRMQRLGMAHLKWLVVRDFNLIESATWWKDGPEIASGELKTEDIETEVFFLPAATHVEKAGSFTQTQRLVQWRHKAVNPPGQCQSELAFFYELGKRIRQRLAGSTDERDRPLLDLTWDYPTDEDGEPDGEGGVGRDQRVLRRRRKRAASRCRRTPSCAPTGRLPAVAGSTPASTRTPSTRPRAASRTAATPRASRSGAGRGRRTGGSCTTARPPTRTASRGATVRGTSGGTPTSNGGSATTCPISWPTGHRAANPIPMRAGPKRSREMTRSS